VTVNGALINFSAPQVTLLNKKKLPKMKIFKSEVVTIDVPNGATARKFYFPDNSVIRTTANQLIKTKGIEFFPEEAVAFGPDGGTNITSVDLASAYLVLYIDGGEFLKMPIARLMSVHNNTTQAWPAQSENYPYVVNLSEFADLQVNWPKSYVLFSAALTATDVVIVSAVYYDSYNR